jgi:arginine deiminase
VLAPLPNLLYQRDTSCWIYGGVSINAMRRPARIPETITDEAIYRWHPMFAQADFDVWYHGADARPATIEGGDILVIGNGAVLGDGHAAVLTCSRSSREWLSPTSGTSPPTPICRTTASR